MTASAGGPPDTGVPERRTVEHWLTDRLSDLVGAMDVESDTTRRKLGKGGLSRAGQAQFMVDRVQRVMETSIACDRAAGMSWASIASLTEQPVHQLQHLYGEAVEAMLAAARAEAPVEDTGLAWAPRVPAREHRGDFYGGPNDPIISPGDSEH